MGSKPGRRESRVDTGTVPRVVAGENQPPRGTSIADDRVRHRCVPERSFGSKVIVARPTDGTPVVLAATAAVVWRRIEAWTTLREIVDALDEAFSTVGEDERRRAASEIVRRLEDDELIERA